MRESVKKAFERIFHAGIRAVDPEDAVNRHVRRDGNELIVDDRSYDLDRFKRVLIFGAGKGAAPMARALEDILGERLRGGSIIVKYGHGLPLQKTEIFEANHPVPDDSGLKATSHILKQLGQCTEDDLVLFAFSGGGSALLPSLRPPLQFQDKQDTTRLLLECGASIDEINTIRKHLSRSKGGMLTRTAYPATVISFSLSDVIGDRLDVIASGPTVPDSTTFQDCLTLFDKYGLNDKVPIPVYELLKRGASGLEPETPKTGDPVFDHIQNVIVGSNLAALAAAAQEAEALGYRTVILTSRVQGEAREVARVMAAVGQEVAESSHPVAPPACILAGGEPTVTICGSGKGGRNQELVLAAAIDLSGSDRVAIMSAGTDGTDGPTDAAGAYADGSTVKDALAKGIKAREFLKRNDSYNFFEPLGLLLKTGPTRTNVMDMICLIVT